MNSIVASCIAVIVAAAKPVGSERSAPRLPNSLNVLSIVSRSAAVLARVSGVIRSDTFSCPKTVHFSGNSVAQARKLDHICRARRSNLPLFGKSFTLKNLALQLEIKLVEQLFLLLGRNLAGLELLA